MTRSGDESMSTRRQLRSSGPLRGTLRVPGDKSISHRTLICNALAAGDARISNLLDSADCRSTMACLEQWGVRFEHDGNELIVRSPGQAAFHEPASVLDCGNSGTSMRLLAGVAAGLPFESRFDGDDSLRRRPMDRVLDPLAQMGAQVDGAHDATRAPFVVSGGNGLRSGFEGELAVASAQVKSCIILASLRANRISRVIEPGPTRDHTERMLTAMGAAIEVDGAEITIRPGSALRPQDVDVPGDISAAAFWIIAAAIVPGSKLRLPEVGVNPRRTGVIDVLRQMGAQIELNNLRDVSGEPVADIAVRGSELHGTVIDGDLIVRALDELPALAVAAASADGVTEIRDAAELRVKESDRIATTSALLTGMGGDPELPVRVEERADGMRIVGGRLRGGAVQSFGDHRLAMAAAVASLAAEGPTELHGAEAVSISYPEFWTHLDQIRNVPAV